MILLNVYVNGRNKPIFKTIKLTTFFKFKMAAKTGHF